ncbi:hypothetical protein SteCoe_15488 [Stentor coeruleus]|uniref:Uncharacterized protein n=1 Tax=Stentor coeruleus TaxID=5963 RepID=A0A1R2C3H0_9CILI|nr:hypothetical protein SteCoe_15488 [Stentor coeruleus]
MDLKTGSLEQFLLNYRKIDIKKIQDNEVNSIINSAFGVRNDGKESISMPRRNSNERVKLSFDRRKIINSGPLRYMTPTPNRLSPSPSKLSPIEAMRGELMMDKNLAIMRSMRINAKINEKKVPEKQFEYSNLQNALRSLGKFNIDSQSASKPFQMSIFSPLRAQRKSIKEDRRLWLNKRGYRE